MDVPEDGLGVRVASLYDSLGERVGLGSDVGRVGDRMELVDAVVL